MKKTLLLLASAALFLVGCAKEQIVDQRDGGMTQVTFTANLDNGVATKAVADGDGAAANVNRCIMEIYYGNELFARQYAPVGSDKKASFTTQIVSNRTYKVAFWADMVDDATTDAGLATDKYYTTTSLREIAIKGNYSGNDDARDAFYHVGQYTIAQAGSSFGDIKLKRPFAQMNVITTDWNKAVSVTGLAPEKVKVTLKNALVKFNAVTEEASGSENLEYEAAVYTAPAPVVPVSATEKTLSMDYLFASADKAVIDIDWKALHGSDIDVAHTFAAVPYQRNYRTNIKGALLTTQGQWTVEVEPTWTTPEYTHPVVIATTLEEAQAAVGPTATGAEAAGTVIVKPEAIANRTAADEKTKEHIAEKSPTIDLADLPEGAKAIEFVLTQQSKKDVTFELPALPDANFYWYIRHEPNYPTENLNVKVDDDDATRVIIDAPNNTHVVLNDVVYTHVIAITGDNTLVVPQGIKVDKLTVKKGGVEIHGEVTALEVTPGTGQNVYFRSCEGLSADVFKEIYSETEPVCNYIDPWYTYEKVGDVYNIVKRPVVAMIGEVEYKSLSDAVAAVPSGNTELVTIKVMSDVVINADALEINKNNVVLDGQGHTIAIDETDTRLDKYLVDGSSKKYGSFQMIKVSGNDVTLKNMTLDSKNYRGASLATTTGGKNASYENIIYKGKGSGHYYGSAASDGTLKFKDCTFETHGYAIHTAESSTELEVSNCDIHGWVSYGDKTIGATFTNTHFYSAEDQYNGVIATIRPYCATTITNCTFSKEYLTKYKYDGLTVRSNVVVSLKGCSVEDGELCDIANITCPDDPWKDGGVMAIDATGNATDGFSAGTFVAKQASDIKAAQGFRIVAVEGKTNVWTTAPVEYKTTLLCNGELFGQYETIADAVKAFNFDENITAGDYTLNIKPGTYNEDMILFIQDKTEGKYRTLLVQSADPAQKVVVKSTSAMKAVFGIAAESDYSGGPITFKNIDIDVSENTNNEPYIIYFAGSQSGKEDLIFPEPNGPTYNRRYGHNVSFDNCNVIGNGNSQAFVTETGTGGIKVENCEITDCVMGFNGYIVALDSHLSYGIHVKNVRFDGGTFINDQSGGASEVSVENCTIKCNRDYAIRTSGSSQLLTKFPDSQFTIKNTTIEVDGAELDKDAGVIYFRTSETHALIENCTVTKKNITIKEGVDPCTLYDIYNKNTTVTINGKNLPSGPGVGMEWLNE